MILDVLTSPYLLAIGIGWLTAHVIKYIIAFVRGEKARLVRHLFVSGGMPSSHASTTVGLWTVVLLKDGADSGLFGLATLIVLVVCYDAVMVRFSSGQQGNLLNRLLTESKSMLAPVRVAQGHTVIEVTAGVALGLLVGSIVFFTTT